LFVNNAATQKRASFIETTVEDWKSDLDIYLTGCYICAKAVAEEMIKNKSGNIMNIA
jgi:short-subunit dehydrogenase